MLVSAAARRRDEGVVLAAVTDQDDRDTTVRAGVVAAHHVQGIENHAQAVRHALSAGVEQDVAALAAVEDLRQRGRQRRVGRGVEGGRVGDVDALRGVAAELRDAAVRVGWDRDDPIGEAIAQPLEAHERAMAEAPCPDGSEVNQDRRPEVADLEQERDAEAAGDRQAAEADEEVRRGRDHDVRAASHSEPDRRRPGGEAQHAPSPLPIVAAVAARVEPAKADAAVILGGPAAGARPREVVEPGGDDGHLMAATDQLCTQVAVPGDAWRAGRQTVLIDDEKVHRLRMVARLRRPGFARNVAVLAGVGSVVA